MPSASKSQGFGFNNSTVHTFTVLAANEYSVSISRSGFISCPSSTEEIFIKSARYGQSNDCSGKMVRTVTKDLKDRFESREGSISWDKVWVYVSSQNVLRGNIHSSFRGFFWVFASWYWPQEPNRFQNHSFKRHFNHWKLYNSSSKTDWQWSIIIFPEI